MMQFDTVRFTPNATIAAIRDTLTRRFPRTAFSVELESPEEPFAPHLVFHGVVVRWTEGPSQDDVEDLLGRFQSLSWNHRTGVLEEHDHVEVTPEGRLRVIQYGIDYVFCYGPHSEALWDD